MLLRTLPGRMKEELIDSPLAIGQPVSEKGQISLESSFGFHRAVNIRIEGIVDGVALTGASLAILVCDSRAAAIGKHSVELGQCLMKRIGRVVRDPLERRGRIYIPEDFTNGGGQAGYTRFEFLVENSDAASFDNYIATLRPAEVPVHFVHIRCVVDHDASPLRIGDITMFLPIVSVRFEERDGVTAAGQRAQNTAIVSSSAIPISGNQAGAPESNVHACTLSIASSSAMFPGRTGLMPR